ncbi:MAG TPA: right-handed parallel beta-helix repeat-containing protein, partial [Cytophagaceae bacterium]|nr:right-handed parallel beta-helix repeat-containing protein [Cytophagaceae bacterium]
MFTLQRTLAITLLTLGLASHASSEAINVTNTNDSGAGSLRQAIIDANADPGFTAILFNIPGDRGAERIINVPTALPAFTAPVDLATAPGQGGRTVLLAPIINGPGAATTGITFNSGSSGSTVTLVTFRSFVFSMVLNAGSENILYNNFENNQGGIDIRLLSGGGNTIQGNIFTTTNTGASAIGGSSTGNTITNNTFTGTGINIAGNGHTIGGPGASDGNTFTNAPGTAINLSSANGALVQNNTITGSTGTGLVAGGIDMQILSNTFSANVGWDINIQTGYFVQIFSNNITGDNSMFNGILVQNGLSYEINGNTVNGGSIELQSTTSSFQYGALTVQNNTITNDPTGYSGHGAISLSNVTNAQIYNNNIHNNASNGIYFLTSTNNYVVNNTIYENARTGIYVTNNLYNKLSRNVVYNNHDDIYGGKTGIYATAKAAPVIVSAVRVGSTFVITGSGSLANDSLEFFLSNRASRNSSLAQNALAYEGAVKATGTTWTVTLPANNQNGEFYFIATATDVNNSTSTYSAAVGVQINGPTSTP